VFAGLKIELIDPQQDGAADNKRKAHYPRIEQIEFDVPTGGRPDDSGRQKRHQQSYHESSVLRIGEHAERNPPQLGKI